MFDYLTDMQKYVSIHPVIYKIDNLTDNNYKIYEKLSFISFTYPATVNGDRRTKTVVMEAVVMKLTKIEMVITLKTEDEHTIIQESISFKSPLPIKGIMETIFEKQHKQLFLNIENTN